MATKHSRARLLSTTCLFYENKVNINDEMIPLQMSRTDLTRTRTRTNVSESSFKQAEDDVGKILPNGIDEDKIESAPLDIASAVSFPASRSITHFEKSLRRNASDSSLELSSTPSPDFPRRVTFPDLTTTTDTDITCPYNLCHTGRGRIASICSAVSLPSLDEDDVTEPSKFRVTFFNKFGKKGTCAEGFKDAPSVSYVYNGAVLVTDMIGNKIVLFGRSGRPERSFITGEYTEPWSAVVTPRGHVAVTLRRHSCVAILSGKGDSMAEFGHEHLQCPTGLAVDKDGRYIVTDEQTNKVYIFSPSRVLLGVVGEEAGIKFKQPRHVCLSTSGRIIVSDSGHHCVRVFDRKGRYVTKFGEYGSGDGQFKFPYGICVDQEGHIIVSDHYNDRVSIFYSDGVFIQHLLTSKNGIKRPRGVAVRCAHNRKLYVTHGGLRATEVVVFRMTLNGTKIMVDVKSYV